MNITFSHLPFDPTNDFLQSTGHISPALNQKIICEIKLLRDKLAQHEISGLNSIVISELFMFRKTSFVIFSSLLVLALFACSSETPPTPVSTNMNHEFLPVEQAFKFSTKVIDKETIQASWDIAEGYYLYKDKIKFEVSSGNHQITNVDYPQSVMLNDKIFGKQESYSNKVDILIKLNGTSDDNLIKLKSVYQGCAKQGLCYPPQTNSSEMSLNET